MEIQDNIDEIRSICNKRPIERSVEEISILVKLTCNCKVFKSLIETNGVNSHSQCCRYLRYQFCPQGQYLFKYGEKGVRFYIILSGAVGVEIPKKNNYGVKSFIEIITLTDGSSFGELALESSKPRAASIKCKSNSHFIFLEKVDYVRLISKIVRDKRDVIVNFLQSLPMFMDCTKGTITKLTYMIKEKHFTKGQIVYCEGDPAEELFIIKEGDFEFYRIIKKLQKSNEKGVGKKEKLKNSKIANLGNGEMFGEEDSLNSTTRTSTCKCVSNHSTVLTINKNDFLKQISQDEIFDYISCRIKEKMFAFNKRAEMLTRIENDDSKPTERKRKKTKLCLEFEKESSLGAFLGHSTSDMSLKRGFTERKLSKSTSLASKNNGIFTRKITKSNSVAEIGEIFGSKTERREDTLTLPEISKITQKRIVANLQNSKKFIPSSLNEDVFKGNKGISVISMNCFHVYQSLWGK